MSSDEDDPTQTPVVIVPTETPAANAAEPTSTLVPTATTDAAPTVTPTVEPTATTEPSPTATATRPLQPTATRAPIVTPTPVPEPVNSGTFEIPDDPLSIMPTLDDVPDGLVITDEGEVDISIVAADFEDSESRSNQLQEWGFRTAVFREMSLPDDQVVDSQAQIIGVITQAVLLDAPESAQQEMQTYFDGVVLFDPDLAAGEISIDPLGDASRAAISNPTLDGETYNFAFIGLTAGPFSIHIIAVGGAQYDPFPDALSAANATLRNLDYASAPSLGEILLQTDFSNWITQEFESGSIALDEDGYYHITVTQGNGAFISAHSTDHDPFTDAIVSVDMQMLSVDPAAQGCVLTRIDQLEQQYDYTLCIDGAGNVTALYEQFDSEGNYSNEPLIAEGSVTVAPPSVWTNLAILASGEEFWFLVDGDVVGSARHTGPPGGAVGVVVNYYAEDPQIPAQVLFTNLAVWAVE